MKLVSLTGKELFNNQRSFDLFEPSDSGVLMKLLQMKAQKENKPVIDTANLKKAKTKLKDLQPKIRVRSRPTEASTGKF